MKLNNFEYFYIIGLVVTGIVSLIILLTGVLSLYLTFLIFFWVVKFLSGFGLILGITNAFLFLLSKFKDRISSKGAKALIVFQIIVPILLIIYGIYKLVSSITGPAGTISMTGVWQEIYVWFDNIIYIYGIASLLLQLYLIPIAKQEFDEAINKGRNQKLGTSLKSFGRNVKKQWFKWREEDAKVKYLDQKSVKELLDNWRDRFAVILLIPLAIGSFIFTPITFILVVMWGKIIIFDRTIINRYEKIALFISMAVVALVAILSPYVEFGLYSQISGYLWTINIFYLIGIILATLIFTVKLLSLQGVSIGAYLKSRRQEKKEEMKSEIKDLKKQKKTLEKETKPEKTKKK